MRIPTPALVLALALLPVAALAGASGPSGTGAIEFKEKFKVSGGCGGFKDVGVIFFTAHGDGTFTASAPAGTFSGNMIQADRKGLKWRLQFDSGSLSDYVDYLEEVTGDLCGAPVTATGLFFKKFEVKFKKDLSSAKVKLKAQGTGATAFGSGKASHTLNGKGDFAPAD